MFDMVGNERKKSVSKSGCWRRNSWGFGGYSQGKSSPCSPRLQFPQLLGTTQISEGPGFVLDGCNGAYRLCSTSSTIPSPFLLAPSPVLPLSPQPSPQDSAPEPLLSPCPATCSPPCPGPHTQPGFRLQAALWSQFITQQVKFHLNSVIGYILCSRQLFPSSPSKASPTSQQDFT